VPKRRRNRPCGQCTCHPLGVTLIGSFFAAWLLADFLSGVGHWFEDRYLVGSDSWVGRHIGAPNEKHHSQPLAFLEGNYWTRNWTCFLASGVGLVIGLAIGLPYWVLLAIALTSQSNEIHAWGHQKCNKFISALQETGFLQSARHHGLHHHSPFNVRYCVHTNWLNPILDLINFWQALEWLLALVGWKVKKL